VKTVYLPLYRVAVSYLVSFGRRWSLLEHLLLVEVSLNKRTVTELSLLANLPDRLVIESMINLMRAGWVEVRSTEAGVFFGVTNAGRRRAKEEDLPVTLQREVKWISLCVDRITGTWLRADELELVYERDIPEGANIIEPLVHTYDANDGALRDLFHLDVDETLEASPPQFRTPSKPYARVKLEGGSIQSGLPGSPMKLHQALAKAAEPFADSASDRPSTESFDSGASLQDTISPSDVIVGGNEHRELLKACLQEVKTTLVIHSCFVSPDTVRALLPEFEDAARRRVRIELLWGLHTDPEASAKRKSISDTEKVLLTLSPEARQRVQLSPVSSGSHAKVIIYDERDTGKWITIVGSCNFLSSEFDWVECSVRSQNQLLASQVLSRLIAAQLPASGSWSPMVRRLNSVWSTIRFAAMKAQNAGSHKLTLLTDDDHYACVTRARDYARKRIFVGCDLYGLAAETSVLVPMESAANAGCSVSLLYCRASKLLRAEGRAPEPTSFKKRGLNIQQHPTFHAKVIVWDDSAFGVTSFNWMSTVVGKHRRGGANGEE
jgi:PLD-like domain